MLVKGATDMYNYIQSALNWIGIISEGCWFSPIRTALCSRMLYCICEFISAKAIYSLWHPTSYDIFVQLTSDCGHEPNGWGQYTISSHYNHIIHRRVANQWRSIQCGGTTFILRPIVLDKILSKRLICYKTGVVTEATEVTPWYMCMFA